MTTRLLDITSSRLARSLAFLALIAAAAPCRACWAPPKEQVIGVDEQLMLATQVVVAKVIGKKTTDDGTENEFLVQKWVAGSGRDFFTVSGSDHDDQDSSFHHHEDQAFWRHGGGKLFNDTDCEIHPSFILGASYLAFVGQPFNRRSFEKLDIVDGQIDARDMWLQYVERKLGKP
ncbi:MAG: hypothetical protein ABIT83_12190 [Massilia sp.]